MNKRILVILVLAICLCCLAACGKDTPAGGDVITQQLQPEGKENALTFVFENVGNDPNNLQQSDFSYFNMRYSTAFDEEYIYFIIDDGAQKRQLARVRYDGTGLEILYDRALQYINIWDGYIYGIDHGERDIVRVDMNTGNVEQITSEENVQEMFIVQGVLFYDYSEDEVRVICAKNLQTQQGLTLRRQSHDNSIYFTTDGRCLYAMASPLDTNGGRMEVYRVLVEDVKSGAATELTKVAQDVSIGYMPALTFAREGIITISSNREEMLLYRYEDIDEQNLTWESVEDPLSTCTRDDLFEGLVASVPSSTSVRYFMGMNIVAAADLWGRSTAYIGEPPESTMELYYFPQADISAGQMIGTISENTGCFGTWEGKTYILEGSVNGNLNGGDALDLALIVVEADGTMSRTPLQS